MGISYSDAQSLSTCRGFPKDDNYTMPRCRSYRLRKNHFLVDPHDTLSSVVTRTNANRTLYFSRVTLFKFRYPYQQHTELSTDVYISPFTAWRK